MPTVGRPRSCDCGVCFKCKRAEYMRAWYRDLTPDERRQAIAGRDPERVRAYDRKRYRENPERQNPAAKRDPAKRRAQVVLSNAVQRGKIIKPDHCSECGRDCNPDGHHEDYAQPLEVVWLCRACHMKRHRKEDHDFVGPRPF